jgi:hypothetical protein
MKGARPNLRVLPGGAPAAERRGPPAAAPHSGEPELPAAATGRPGGFVADARQLPAAAAGRPRGFAAGARQLPVVATGRSRGFVAGALATAGSWLLEPAVPSPEPPAAVPPDLRPVVAVFGLARGCGVTVVARALAAELARRDVEGAAAVHCDTRAAGIPLATQAAARLARALADVPGADTRAVGRLCLVAGADQAAVADSARHHAPLVLDAGSASLGGAAAALAERVVVVATPSTEPALASVAADCLRRVGREPIVVLNRTTPDHTSDGAPGWARGAAHRLPDSRMGAQLALGGREARGELGRAVAELADLCEAGP